MSLSNLFSFLYSSPNQRRIISDIKNPYSDLDPVGICSGCRARDAHITDMRQLLHMEKEQRDMLIARVLGINQVESLANEAQASSGVVTRPGLTSLAERRRQAREREAQTVGQTPEEAKGGYWKGRNEAMKREEETLHARIAAAAIKRAEKDKEVPEEAKQDQAPQDPTGPVDTLDSNEREETRAALD